MLIAVLYTIFLCFNCFHQAKIEKPQDPTAFAENMSQSKLLSRFSNKLDKLAYNFKEMFIAHKSDLNDDSVPNDNNYKPKNQFAPKGKSFRRRAATNCDCGHKRKSKVIGGNDIHSSNAHPWMVALFLQEIGFICGGSLITKKHVLTAGHCIYNFQKSPSVLTVIIGTANLANLGNSSMNVSVTGITTHPLYEPAESQNNDIAILQLAQSTSIMPVCLPQTGTHFPDSNTIILGWGTTESEYMSSVLQEGKLKIIPRQECKRMYKYEDVTDGMICAGRRQGGVDSCQGDSGGPLVQKKHGRSFIVGISSWGYGCGRARFPGIYTKVSHYSQWIHEHTSKLACQT